MGFQWNPRGGSSLHCFLFELDFGNVVFCGGRKTGVPGEKPENQQQTQPTYDTESGNRTRATLVGGKCSTTAPSLLLDWLCILVGRFQSAVFSVRIFTLTCQL